MPLGFDILYEEAATPFGSLGSYTPETSEQLIKELKSMPIAEDFSRYSLEELASLTGFWVLKNGNKT